MDAQTLINSVAEDNFNINSVKIEKPKRSYKNYFIPIILTFIFFGGYALATSYINQNTGYIPAINLNVL